MLQLAGQYQPRGDDLAVIELQVRRLNQPQLKEMYPVASSVPIWWRLVRPRHQGAA
jgi:hypothetical protein